MKKLKNIVIVLVLLVSFLNVSSAVAYENPITVNGYLASSIYATKTIICPTSDIPKEVYVEKKDSYGNVYKGMIKREKILNYYNTGKVSVKYSGYISLY